MGDDFHDVAVAWMAASGLDERDFSIARSAVQSAPPGCISLDLVRSAAAPAADPNDDPPDDRARLRASRVLEIDTAARTVVGVLAGRDPKMLESEAAKVRAARLKAELEGGADDDREEVAAAAALVGKAKAGEGEAGKEEA